MWIASLAISLAAPPATVLEHRLDVAMDSGRRLRATQTWTVRIDDPAACVAGLLAPPGLDGAADPAGALVIQDLLIVPADARAGDTFTLVASSRASSGSHSGIFQTAPELPVLRAEVVVSTDGRQPLTVWADPLADTLWSTRRGKTATVTWTDLTQEQRGRLVWSSWDDWISAGTDLESVMSSKLTDKAGLGRALAADLASSNLPEVVSRTFQLVKIDPSAQGDLQDARSAMAVADSGSGTPVERALVLISMLRGGGYPANLVMIRPASASGGFPVTVASPEMLRTPMVLTADRQGRPVWIDPGTDSVAVPSIPAALIGATVWTPGDLPSQQLAPGVVDGEVRIQTSATVASNGSVTWSSDILPTGTAVQAIRELLRPLDEAGREQAIRRLILQARATPERLSIQNSGMIDPRKPFQLTVSGIDTQTFTPLGEGLRGSFTPVLASAMAGWLPPNIRVHETIDLGPPGSHVVTAFETPGASYDPDAQIDTSARRSTSKLRIEVEAVRPYAASITSQDVGSAAFFAKTALQSTAIFLFPPANKVLVKSIDKVELPTPERRALQARLWWSVDNTKQGTKVLKKAVATEDPLAMVAALHQWVGSDDPRPWEALFSLIPVEETAARLDAVRRLGPENPTLAASLAEPLAKSADSEVAIEALLHVLAVRPDQTVRNGIATRLDGVKNKTLQDWARLDLALYDLDAGMAPAQALKSLSGNTPLDRMVQLLGEPLSAEQARKRSQSIVAEEPDNAELRNRQAAVLSSVGLHREALEASLQAARLANDDAKRWAAVIDRAMRAGNLRQALDAARRGSELEPTDKALAARLHHIGTLARDPEAVALAIEHDPSLSPYQERTLDDLSALAQQHELLAVLQVHADVEEEPVFLGLRAQLRRDAGSFDEAARDGINLARRHQEPRGKALAFAATVGRVFGTGSLSLLDDVDDETARLTRMDYRLITASADPRADARAMRDQPRATDVLLATTSPKEAAAKMADWPADLPGLKMAAPRGYQTNSALSSVQGVQAWSHADRQLLVMVVNGETEVLPPPLGLMFTVDPRPLRTFDDGSTMVALRDGYLPLLATRWVDDGKTWYGLGFTEESARRAFVDLRDSQR